MCYIEPTSSQCNKIYSDSDSGVSAKRDRSMGEEGGGGVLFIAFKLKTKT